METWQPSIAFLTDLLSIVTLKSAILGHNNPEKKDAYEKEAEQIMGSLNQMLSGCQIEDYGKFIRGVQVNMLANRLIWENETKARLGGESQNHLLPLTHTINGLRMTAGNVIVAQTGGRKDLNLDRLNHTLCGSFGFDFRGLP